MTRSSNPDALHDFHGARCAARAAMSCLRAALFCGAVGHGAAGCSDASDTTYVAHALEGNDSARGGSIAEQTPIVFRSDRGAPGVGDIYVMAADGSNVRRLTEGGDFTVPSWAPDGKSVAFRQRTGAEGSLGLLAPENGERVLLATGLDASVWLSPLSWSAQGDELLYGFVQGAALPELRAISRSGGQARPMLTAAEGARDAADVSRVHSRIVYRWKQDVVPGAEHGMGTTDLWVVDGPDDPEPENVTKGRVYAPNSPRWSPDGTHIAFAGYALAADGTIEGFGGHGPERGVPPDAEIFVIDVLADELTRLTNDDEDDSAPSWTPDGSSLIFASARDHSDADIWRMPLAAPDEAVNLIDDGDNPGEELMPDYFSGALPLE